MKADSTSLLRYHNNKEHPLHRLPFVSRDETKGRNSFWAVPRTGGYSGGIRTGEALARIYLNHLRAHGATAAGSLQTIAIDMFNTSDDWLETNTIHGQAVGFFTVLEPWIALAAQKAGAKLDRSCPLDLVDLANYGLNFDEAAYIAQLDEIAEEVA